MPTNQPLSDSHLVPVIETVLAAAPPVVLGHSAPKPVANTQDWKALEDRIAALGPKDGDPEKRTDDDGYLLPNRTTIAVSLQIAARLRENGICVPLRLGQTANGGIKFEWRAGNRTERLTVDAHGETELAQFEDSRLVVRKPVHFVSAHR